MAGYDEERLREVFEYGDGECACCGKQLSFSNYGAFGRKGAWEVDHRVPLARGGSDNLRNLQPACIPCNRGRGADGFCTYCGCES